MSLFGKSLFLLMNQQQRENRLTALPLSCMGDFSFIGAGLLLLLSSMYTQHLDSVMAQPLALLICLSTQMKTESPRRPAGLNWTSRKDDSIWAASPTLSGLSGFHFSSPPAHMRWLKGEGGFHSCSYPSDERSSSRTRGGKYARCQAGGSSVPFSGKRAPLYTGWSIVLPIRLNCEAAMISCSTIFLFLNASNHCSTSRPFSTVV